ncbi:MAG: DUF1549 and DUF1553 domain-containing protein, partial [Planctomycetota bacterium]
EKVVDRLLSSPRFGEHWARHWLDLVRYAETGGHEFDYPIPNAWRYRDYVIRAFNSDLPYDQLIREHIAGDLISDPRVNHDDGFNESILGTGFWYLGEDFHGPVDVRADQVSHFDNQIDVMSKTFLGLTVACARCHDHKFDAISTADFYALAGFLKSSRRQEVMLDPGNRIGEAYHRAEQLHSTGAGRLPELMALLQSQIENGETEAFNKYVAAALQVLRTDPEWGRGDMLVFEGEDIPEPQATGGTADVQQLEPDGDFSWRHNKQLFWRDAQPGDKLSFSLDVDTTATSKFELFANLTIATDYGIVSTSVNGITIADQVDYYADALGTTGRVKLGDINIDGGAAAFEFEIEGANESAIKRHMFGIDYLELVPIMRDAANSVAVADAAAAHGLEESGVTAMVEALRSPALASPRHPLHLLQLLSKASFIDGPKQVRDGFRNRISRRSNAVPADDSVLFADFSDGIPENWTASGFALNHDHSGTAAFSAAGPAVMRGGTVSSATRGGNFYGVLRSPTFTIDHEKIHFRIAGEGVKVRVVVEGHWMDRYNALLFAGLSFDLRPNDQRRAVDFYEHVMAGDLKLQKGHQAHIEIIDHGEGWFALDEIRFSNSGDRYDPATSVESSLVETLVEDNFVEPESCSEFVAESVFENISQKESGSEEVVSWLIENGLAGLVTARAGGLATSLVEARNQVREAAAAAPAPQFAVGMIDGSPEDEYVLVRGNHKIPGDIVERRFLEAFVGEEGQEFEGSGRLELADMIADPGNPLTSRVMVNRLWHHLFGRGLVSSVDNFGVLGVEPTHPELLDYLAGEFTRDGWSIKRMVRRLVLTRTYQMASVAVPETVSGIPVAEVDPDNLLLHRANVRRITSESIRDSMLQISGRLDDRMYGAPVKIHLNKFMEGRGRPGGSGPLDGAGRRSIYVEVRRNFLSPMMLAFDTPIPLNTIGRRNKSNVPAQALILMNDPLVIELAGLWAGELVDSGGTIEQRIDRMFLTAFGHPPTAAQAEDAMQFLTAQAELLEVPKDDIAGNKKLWQDLCHVVFNVKQFIYLD